jgi:hypothetical protein
LNPAVVDVVPLFVKLVISIVPEPVHTTSEPDSSIVIVKLGGGVVLGVGVIVCVIDGVGVIVFVGVTVGVGVGVGVILAVGVIVCVTVGVGVGPHNTSVQSVTKVAISKS